MITCKLMGQMGNQMFQVSTLYAHAKRNNVEYCVPHVSGRTGQFEFAFKDRFPLFQGGSFPCYYKEPKFGIYESIPFQDNTILIGYWQSAKYFNEYRNELSYLFGIFTAGNRDEVSIHIRRGDSLNHVHKIPQPTKKYLDDAIGFFPSNTKFLVFSDDILWCKEYFKGDRFSFSEGRTSKENMGLMAACSSNIIVNSTFSWWGAYANYNKDKKVICPSVKSWFTPAYEGRLSAQDIVCEDWIQIDY